MGTKFYPIPNVALYPANPTQAQLDQQIKEWTDLETLGLIKNAEVMGFANAEHAQRRYGWGELPNGTPKTWWLDAYRAITGVWIEQDATGRWMTENNPGPGGTITGMQFTKIGTYNHVRNYVKHFRVVPKLIRRDVSADEAVRMSLLNGPGSPPPLSQTLGTLGVDFRTTWPEGISIRINPDNPMLAEAYRIAEFEAEFPITTSVHIPTNDPMEASGRVNQVRGLLNSGKPTLEIDTLIRGIYAPKGTFTGGGFAG
jgi:hypothetical protein